MKGARPLGKEQRHADNVATVHNDELMEQLVVRTDEATQQKMKYCIQGNLQCSHLSEMVVVVVYLMVE